MKELSIKEKAKRYDEAIIKAKALCGQPLVDNILLETIFPELKESIDERVKKVIKQVLSESTTEKDECYLDNGVTQQEVFAWLEKQCEQKPADKVEPKFKVGDWVTNIIETVRIIGYDIDYGYQVDYKGNLQHRDTNIIEKEYRLWTIQDAKDGDVLVDNDISLENPLIFILKDFKHVKYANNSAVSDYHSHCFLKANKNQDFCIGTWHHKTNIYPATQEQRDLLFAKMKDAGYEWDADKKELKKIEVKEAMYDNLAWSEEDDKERKHIIGMLEGWMQAFKNTIYRKDCEAGINWLKSLRPQKQWKPSEEQMEALKRCCDGWSDNGDGILDSLYKQLKKLK